MSDKVKTEPEELDSLLGSTASDFNQPLRLEDLDIPGIDTPAPQTQASGPAPSQNDRRDAGPEDTSKLNDAIAAAGVDIQREEELLTQQPLLNRQSTLPSYAQQQQARLRQFPFLHPYHVAVVMNRIARENGITQNFNHDPELLDLMSAACQHWILLLVQKTITLSRHRRRGIPALAKNAKKVQKPTPNSTPRSELLKELRNIALKQKEMEERRVNKRVLLGLEKNNENDGASKAGAEETLHRAANATAAMMTMGKKKYSWMTSGSTAVDETTPGDHDVGKQSTIISIRGDNGLRYREIRTGNTVTMKDLLGVIEDERLGTEKAVVKGYAKLKD